MSAFELDLGYQYKSIKNRSNSLSGVEAKAANNGNTNTNFGADLFNGLFQRNPQLKGDGGLYNETLQAVQNSDSFKKIRQQTQGNVNWSAIGAGILLDELTKAVDYSDEPPPPGDEPQPKPDNKDKEEEEKQGKGKGEQDNEGEDSEEGEPNGEGDEPNPEGEPNEEDGEDSGEGNEEEEEEGNGGNEEEDYEDEDSDEPDEPGKPPIPVSQKIQNAVDKAGEKLGEMLSGLKEGTGGGLSISDVNLVDGFTQLASNPGLVEVMRRIGRLKLNNSFLSALQVGGPEETYGVTYGNDLQHLMPTDLAGIAGNDDEFMVWADKYNKRNLQQRQFQSNVKPGKGPMIVCIDISTSMQGDRVKWAQTIAAAMYLLAVKEHRAYAAVPFNGRAYSMEPKDQKKLDPSFLSRVVGLQANGGTSFDAPWNASVGFMDKVKRGPWSNADIVFITDGESGLDKDQWVKDKTKFSVRLFTFLLGVAEPEQEDKVERYTYEWFTAHGYDKAYVDENYKDYLGKPIRGYNGYEQIKDLSDAVVYVPKFDDESVANSFALVKHADQRKGKMVKA